MEPEPPPDAWDERLGRRDPAAAEQIFARYARRLVRVAEQYLSRRLSGRFDGEDVVQSVFRTFFRRAEEGQFRIDSSAQLWQLLVRITVLKARAKGRYHTAGLRDAGAEAGGDPGALLAGALAGEPGPDEAAVLVDQIDALLRRLPEVYGRVLELRLCGDHVTEIAERLGLSRQGIYRMLALLQDRLADLDPDARPRTDRAGRELPT
jgi:RNA polymerase sigma-70 factor, ECF subfamily